MDYLSSYGYFSTESLPTREQLISRNSKREGVCCPRSRAQDYDPYGLESVYRESSRFLHLEGGITRPSRVLSKGALQISLYFLT